MTCCSNCGCPCEPLEQLYVTGTPLVVHGNFCVYCCVTFGWASPDILDDDPHEHDDDDPDDLAF